MMETGGVRRRHVEDVSSRIRDDGSDSGTKLQTQTQGGGFFLLLKISILVFLVLPAIAIVIVDFLLKSPINAESYKLPPPPKFEGALAQNDLLSRADRLYENELRGPESLVVKQGVLYTGTGDGRIVKIEKGELSEVTRLGTPPCGRFEDEPTCGRPLGMRFDKHGYLVVVDAYLGLYKVNVATGDAHQLFPSSMQIGGFPCKFLNDISIGSDGTIYITDSSTKWDRRHNRYAVVENSPNGRLFAYDPVKNTTKVLVDGLHFANGVQISQNEEYLLVTETTHARVQRHYLKGPKAGTTDIFADNLPGLPDNIRLSSTGGYWVAMAVSRGNGFSVADYTSDKPWIRNFITKVLPQEMLIKFAGKKYGLIIELDKSGKIVRSLHDPSGAQIPAVSEVEDDRGTLYLGSYFSPFIGKLDAWKIQQ